MSSYFPKEQADEVGSRKIGSGPSPCLFATRVRKVMVDARYLRYGDREGGVVSW